MVVGRFLQGVGGGGLVPGDAGAGRRPLPRRPPRRPARRGLRGPGARQRPRPAVRRRRALRRRLARRSSRSTSPSGWCWPPRSARSPACGDCRPPAVRRRAGLLRPRRDLPDCRLLLLRHPRRRRHACSSSPGAAAATSPGARSSSRSPATGAGPRRSAWSRSSRCALFLVRCATAARPLVDLRGWARAPARPTSPARCCWPSHSAGVILAFATADPQVQVFSDRGLWYLLGSARRRRRLRRCTCAGPRRRWSPAARCADAGLGLALVSFFVGAALIAALIDIPIFARTTVYPDSQLPPRWCWSASWSRCRSAPSSAAT